MPPPSRPGACCIQPQCKKTARWLEEAGFPRPTARAYGFAAIREASRRNPCPMPGLCPLPASISTPAAPGQGRSRAPFIRVRSALFHRRMNVSFRRPGMNLSRRDGKRWQPDGERWQPDASCRDGHGQQLRGPGSNGAPAQTRDITSSRGTDRANRALGRPEVVKSPRDHGTTGDGTAVWP